MFRRIVLMLLLPLTVLAQQETKQQPDVWQPLRFLTGTWEGITKGEPGEGKVERE